MGKTLWQVLVWLVYILLNYAINKIFIDDIRFLDNLLVCLILILFFYWFLGLLLLIYRKKHRIYGIALFLLSIFVFYYIAYAYIYKVLPAVGVTIFEEGMSFDQKEFLQNYCVTIFRALIYAFLYFLVLRTIDLSRRREQDLHEKLALTEQVNQYHSKFLTSQIFPHFVRNTFQAMVSEATMRGDEEMVSTIFTLSGLMDYTTEQANRGSGLVYVKKEVKYLELLANLIRQQYGDEAVVEFVKEGNFAGEKIPPLTLLTFVENGFKFGSISAKYPLLIHASYEEPGFSFFCRNRKKSNPGNRPSSKIGLNNVKQRLEMHLSNRHELKIEEDPDYFEVMLAIRRTV